MVWVLFPIRGSPDSRLVCDLHQTLLRTPNQEGLWDYGRYERRREMQPEKQRRRNDLENIGAGLRIILKWIIKKQDGTLCLALVDTVMSLRVSIGNSSFY